MNARLTKLWWFVNDRVYPRLRRFSTAESERERALAQTEQEQYLAQIAGLPDDEHVLAEQLEACVKLLDEEEAARRGVEARLTSIVGLSSIAGTIVFSGILALATGTLRADTIVLRSVMALGALYLALQICWAILASVRGLERRPYIAQNPSGILPLPNEVALFICAVRSECAPRGSLMTEYRTTKKLIRWHWRTARRRTSSVVWLRSLCSEHVLR